MTELEKAMKLCDETYATLHLSYDRNVNFDWMAEYRLYTFDKYGYGNTQNEAIKALLSGMTHKCPGCGFDYYKTNDEEFCLRCLPD